MEEFICTIVILGFLVLMGVSIGTKAASDTERSMKQQIVDEHRAEWVADEKGVVHFKWINAVEAK